MDEDTNELLMPFLDKDEKFVYGFECGQLWEWMQANKKFENYLIHQINEGQIEMMCKRFFYKYEFEKLEDTWSIFNAEPIIGAQN